MHLQLQGMYLKHILVLRKGWNSHRLHGQAPWPIARLATVRHIIHHSTGLLASPSEGFHNYPTPTSYHITTKAMQPGQARVRILLPAAKRPPSHSLQRIVCQTGNSPTVWWTAEKWEVSEVANQQLHHLSGTEPDGQCLWEGTGKETKQLNPQ